MRDLPTSTLRDWLATSSIGYVKGLITDELSLRDDEDRYHDVASGTAFDNTHFGERLSIDEHVS